MQVTIGLNMNILSKPLFKLFGKNVETFERIKIIFCYNHLSPTQAAEREKGERKQKRNKQ